MPDYENISADNILRHYDNAFNIKVRGFSFNIKTNFGSYRTYAKRLTKKARKQAQALCIAWANTVALEAKKRCPHYSGGLADAIKVSGIKGAQGRSGSMSIDVGVDGSAWHSDYDAVLQQLISKGVSVSSTLMASGELAVYLHDYWDQIAGNRARGRAKTKGSFFGVEVGDHFLSRAYYDTKDQYAVIAYETMRMSTKGLGSAVDYDRKQAKANDAFYYRDGEENAEQ